jgi:hypothetical protein
VRREDDDPTAVGSSAEQPEHLGARRLVEVARRLVGENE